MSTTLTNGLKLPDKGSVDWYADMQNNYTILDGAVGTVAEHTTQIAGKAPAVHTHTKADITDLFNSANEWTGDNTYLTFITYKSNHELGNLPQNVDAQSAFRISDSAGTNYLAQIATYQSTDSTGLRFTIRDKFDSNGFSPSGTNRNKHFYFLQNASNQSYIQWDGYANNSIVPLANNTYDLGTSTNKWKSLNGINPGALSLPNLNTTYRQSVDTTDWVLDGSSANSFTPSISGWLNIRITDAVGNYIFMQSRAVSVSNQSTGSLPSSVSRPLSSLIPVVAGEPVSVLVQTTSIVGFIYPCLGNV